MNMIVASYVLALTLFGQSCITKLDNYFLGKVYVSDFPDAFFTIYSSRNFDYTNCISCEFFVNDSNQLMKMRFISGTLDYERDTRNIYTGMYDSIVYLAYGSPFEVYVLIDLKTEKVYPSNWGRDNLTYVRSDSILNKIKNFNDSLYGSWNK